MNFCTAYRKTEDQFGRTPHCKNGFMVNSGCLGIDGAVPQCLDEKVIEHFYPETGTPLKEFKLRKK